MNVRPPAVAGQFYPHSPEQLRATIEQWDKEAPDYPKTIRALVVPHAGYVFSGAVAAEAFRHLKAQSGRIHKVVLLGPSHYFAFQGCALPTAEYFSTPLGNIPVDTEGLKKLAQEEDVVWSDEAHDVEHCLEVQLPLLQMYLGSFRILPILTSQISPARVAALIEPICRDDDCLLVVSSDLSHYHAYAQAQALDQRTCEQIEALQPSISPEQACGSTGINTLLLMAEKRRYELARTTLINSGDTEFGDQHRVVGYVSYLFSDPK
ncbi:AmmeMemoRadiSam system protein B [Vibrio alfacsensis]|uniref:AmmeMemoRadiSam system protein B n=1 Tax=Vibrio alfacsensis TaxID=1074311 RepID=UPI00406837CB